MSNKPPGRTTIQISKDSTPVSFNDFCAHLNKHVPVDSAKRACLLAGACELSPTIPENELLTPEGYTLFAVAALIVAAKTLSDGVYPLLDAEDSKFDSCGDAARFYVKFAEGILPDSHFTQGTGEESREEKILQLVSIFCSNSTYQTDAVYQICNALILTGLAGFRRLPAAPDQVNELFAPKTGISAKEYFMFLFGLWAVAAKSHSIHLDHFIQAGPNRERLRAASSGVLSELSFRSGTSLNDPLFSFARNYSGKAYAEAILLRRPLIQVSEKQFHLAGHPFLKVQMTSKFLTKALTFAAETYGGNRTNRFSEFVAKERFEGYFEELCNYWEPAHGHFAEYEYLRGHNSQSPDRILFERHGSKEAVTLFQLKIKILRDDTHFGGSIEALYADLGSAYSDSVSKSIEFLFKANNASVAGSLRPETAALTRRILDAEHVNLIGITPDLPPLFTFKPIREKLLAEVQRKVRPEAWDWFSGKYGNRWRWHIMDLDEFQIFLSLPSDLRHFHKRFYKYMGESGMNMTADDGGMPSNFRTYLIRRFGKHSGRKEPRIDKHIPELEGLFRAFFDEMKVYFALKPEPT